MIYFKDWTLSQKGALPAMQYDHLSCLLQVQGTFPEGYDWVLLVQAGEAMNLIAMEPDASGLSVRLTAKELSQRGYYQMQLRGTRGDEVRHTNVIRVFVAGSLTGDARWPVIPTEFTQLEQRITAAAQRAETAAELAEELSVHMPEIREGTWWVYDQETDTYRDTGIPAQMQSVQPDWQQNEETAEGFVKNRTHYETQETVQVPLKLQWDGDPEGMETVTLPMPDMDFKLCKLSELVLSAEELYGTALVLRTCAEDETADEELVVGVHLPMEDLSAMGAPVLALQLDGMPLFLAVQEACNWMGCDFTPGLWCIRMEVPGMLAYFSSVTTVAAVTTAQQTVVKQLDNRYLEPFAVMEIPALDLYPETLMLFGAKKLMLEGVLELTEGQDYVVRYNGADVPVRCESMEFNGQTARVLGNQALAGGADSGEAFLIVSVPAEGQIVFHVSSIAAAIHSFGIRTAVEQVYKLKNQYLGLDCSWMPERSVTQREIVTDITVWAGRTTLGREFRTAAFGHGGRYVVTWNGVEYPCTAKGFVMGTEMVDLLIGNVPLALSNAAVSETKEPFCFRLGVNAKTGEIGDSLLYAVEDGVFSVRGEVEQWSSLPYHAAPAAYTIPTELPVGEAADGDSAVPYHEVRQAEQALRAGAKVYGTCQGETVEVLAVYPDAADDHHKLVFMKQDGSVYYGSCGEALLKTPAVQREDIVLLEGSDANYRIFVQEGDLRVEDPARAETYRIPRVEGKALILESATAGSSKKFAVTVDDTGTLRASEVVE